MAILIVDDVEENLYMLETLLTGHGYEVVKSINGEEALVRALEKTPEMIISDILMPKMDGFAFCRKCKQNNQLKNIPFVIYTATYTDQKDEEFALSLGAERFIVKPAEPDVFIQIIQEVLENPDKEKTASSNLTEAEEEIYLRKHNEALVRKLEHKLKALQESNLSLEQEIAERRLAEKKTDRISGEKQCIDP